VPDYRYFAELQPDDGSLMVTFPDVPEAITFGADRREALRMGAEALGLALRGYLADDRPLPPRRAEGALMLAPHADDTLKIALVETFRDSGLSVDAFRERLGVKDWEAAALLDPDRINDIDEMEDALAALGQRLRITVEAA
jgi:antitoxin HicB